MKALPLILILFIACDQGISPLPDERIDIVSVEGVDAISALLTFQATGNPTVTVLVVDTSGEQHISAPSQAQSLNGLVTGTIEFSPVGPAARSITLIAVWGTHRIEIPVKRP